MKKYVLIKYLVDIQCFKH